MEFDFVGDRNFQLILKRDFKEVQKCLEIGANKAAIILSGSILETILSDYFYENPPGEKTKSDILKLTLNELLELAVKIQLINPSENSLATVLKTYRNLIHPGKEVRSVEIVDQSTSKLAFSILELLLNKIERKYKEKFIHTAEEILDKLDEDWNFNSIYGIVITKLSGLEKNKLFDELIEIEIELKANYKYFENPDEPKTDPLYPNIEWTKNLTLELIPLLSNDFLITKLKELQISVTKGECIESVARYNLLHEHLNLLNKDEQELMAIYMISTFKSIFEDSRDLVNDKTYSTIGKYIHTDKGLIAIKGLISFCIVHFGSTNLSFELDALEQIINSLSPENKNIVLRHMNDIILSYKETLPKDIEEFALEADKRGLISLN